MHVPVLLQSDAFHERGQLGTTAVGSVDTTLPDQAVREVELPGLIPTCADTDTVPLQEAEQLQYSLTLTSAD